MKKIFVFIGDTIIDWLIKIGGSLFPEKAIELIDSLKNLKESNGINCLIVTGGGEFANLIRKYDNKINFSNDITHETAIDSMDIMAKLLNDKFEFTELVYSFKDAKKASNNGKIPILACSVILKDNDEIPHTWNLTSDSISAYVANILKAKLLIATNVEGIYTRKPTSVKAKFIHKIDAKKLLTFEETSVDLMLGELLLKFGMNCFVTNGNFPERVLSLIEGNSNSEITNHNFNESTDSYNNEKNSYNFKYTLIQGE
ncbi:MAG: delta 1-pyrroline-5-carboxylate synthetase [Methanobrevibacter sp.]|nr:delta 1-pyrroline-5-carboxylate synthetase [Methanobrevibacter sp.]